MSLGAELHARDELLRLVLDQARAASAAIAAIELCPDDDGQREADLALVRRALDHGMRPRDIGTLFVTAVADLAFDVDWDDQFRFWPILNESLGARRMNVVEDLDKRRDVADAFAAFADAHAGVRPIGQFAEQFPLMSWPLVHALLPVCAQRPMSRLLERASARGLVPTDPDQPWDFDALTTVGDQLGLPLFFEGILENPQVLERGGRALLGQEAAGSPPWLRRVQQRLRADPIARELIDEARRVQARPRAARAGRRDERPALRLLLEQAPGAGTALSVEIGPLAQAAARAPDLEALARAHATLIVRIGVKNNPGHLFNALRGAVVVPVAWKDGELRVELSVRRDDPSPIPEALKTLLAGWQRTFAAPLFFCADEAGRLVEAAKAQEHELAALVLDASSPVVGALREAGVAGVPVLDCPRLIAFMGRPVGALGRAAEGAGIRIEADRPALSPVLAAPVSCEAQRVTYLRGVDAWLEVQGVASGAAVTAVLGRGEQAEALDLRAAPSGALLLRIPAEQLTAGPAQVRVLDDAGKILCKREIRSEEQLGERVPLRWRLRFSPAEPSINALLAGLCWFELEMLPGVTVVLSLELEGREPVLDEIDTHEDPLAAGARIKRMAERVNPPNAEAAPPIRGLLRVWAKDEPSAPVEVARFEPRALPVRFLLDGASGPAPSADEAHVTVERLAFSTEGLGFTIASPEECRTAGVFVATAGKARAALCVGGPSRMFPRLPDVQRPPRGLDAAARLLATLRALDVAQLWPPKERVPAFLMRAAAVRAGEHALVGSLCGAQWLLAEQGLPIRTEEPGEIAKAIASLVWLPRATLDDALEEEEPFRRLELLLAAAGMSDALPSARHLLLVLLQRGMAPPRRDAEALRWAWADVQRPRLVRACQLVASICGPLGGADAHG